MARHTPRERLHAVDMQVPEGRVLDTEFWLRFGTNVDPVMRDKILFVTIDDVSRVGPATFNVKLVCEALDISYSLINHHFGSRDELLAEATVLTYAMYVEELWHKAQQAPADPAARLETWIRASIDWSSRMSGWGAVLNYPTAALDVTEFIRERYNDAMIEWGTLNLARLYTLIFDVRNDTISEDPGFGTVDKAGIMSDPELVVECASIGWAVLGVSVWHAGQHLPTGEIAEIRAVDDQLVDAHVARLIQQARGAV